MTEHLYVRASCAGLMTITMVSGATLAGVMNHKANGFFYSSKSGEAAAARLRPDNSPFVANQGTGGRIKLEIFHWWCGEYVAPLGTEWT
jgi:hypothetical protein